MLHKKSHRYYNARWRRPNIVLSTNDSLQYRLHKYSVSLSRTIKLINLKHEDSTHEFH